MTLPHRVSLYHLTPTKAASTGAAIIGAGTEYPSAYATAARAFAQPQPGAAPHPDYVSGTTTWHVYFGADPALSPNDMIAWTDNSGTVRYLVVTLVRDLAGRGRVWRAECYERLAS